jgi:energy-coupling factor transporter ATP-binding protein EcfA2
MANLAIHPTTQAQLDRFMAAPSHAVLLTGTTGIGKTSLANYLAERLQVQPAYMRRITSLDGKAIGIEPIRELEHFLSLAVPGRAAIKRVIIIEQSQLKTLEEPPVDTVIIMTAPSVQSLLPTIQSRLQTIAVIKPAKAELAAVLPSDKFDVVYAISGGLPGLLQALVADESHPLTTAVAVARQLLGQSSYERLLQVDRLSKDKQLAQDTLAILQQMAHISLQTATGLAAKRWQGILGSAYEAAKDLSNSGQPKLVLTKVLLSI